MNNSSLLVHECELPVSFFGVIFNDSEHLFTTYNCLSYYSNVYVIPALALLGCAGYLFLFVRRPAAYDRFYWHVSAMAFWDCSLMLLTAVAHFPSFVLNGEMIQHGQYMAWHFYIIQPFARLMLTGTQWQSVVLAVER